MSNEETCPTCKHTAHLGLCGHVLVDSPAGILVPSLKASCGCYKHDQAAELEYAHNAAIAYAEVVKNRTAPMPVLMVSSLIEKAFLAGWDAAKKHKE